jgi:hypothetical protein
VAWTNAHAPCSRAKPRGRRSGMAPECALAMTYMRDARCEMREEHNQMPDASMSARTRLELSGLGMRTSHSLMEPSSWMGKELGRRSA